MSKRQSTSRHDYWNTITRLVFGVPLFEQIARMVYDSDEPMEIKDALVEIRAVVSERSGFEAPPLPSGNVFQWGWSAFRDERQARVDKVE